MHAFFLAFLLCLFGCLHVINGRWSDDDPVSTLSSFYRIPQTVIVQPRPLQSYSTAPSSPPIRIQIEVAVAATPSDHNLVNNHAMDPSLLSLCIEIVNRRHSWHLQVSCSSTFSDFSNLELSTLSLPPGVYSMRAYFLPAVLVTFSPPPGSSFPP